MVHHKEGKGRKGPFTPTLILHGGAGAISRANLPPELYQQYRKSLLWYLTATKSLLDEGTSALDAACHAVSLMEDDPLFNCGRGSVFTKAGTIEMEASVMVASVSPDGPPVGSIKRGAAVSLIRNTRHPILLAKEVLRDADDDDGLGGTSTMHCHLSGASVEKWGFEERGLEQKGDDWFWTKRRWDEHRRGLTKSSTENLNCEDPYFKSLEAPPKIDAAAIDDLLLPSQGTVGAVCMDYWGTLAVATSTGGLTNKAPGRIGDTPTIGAGFWADSWPSKYSLPDKSPTAQLSTVVEDVVGHTIGRCLPFSLKESYAAASQVDVDSNSQCETLSPGLQQHRPMYDSPIPPIFGPQCPRRAVAMSGTGNGDSFLRTNAVRSAAALCRFASPRTSLSQAITAIAGPNGELQRSADDRWHKTGEGQGGIIGIEISNDAPHLDRFGFQTAHVVFDFNCGGLWRAYYQRDPDSEKDIPWVMVFRDDYKA